MLHRRTIWYRFIGSYWGSQRNSNDQNALDALSLFQPCLSTQHNRTWSIGYYKNVAQCATIELHIGPEDVMKNLVAECQWNSINRLRNEYNKLT